LSEQPGLLVANPQDINWDTSVDVLVVGFGGAGACAAIEAADQGAKVLAVDRFAGGGATSASGGVCYAGGTRFQREAGFDDTADNMFRYLQVELNQVVPDSWLREFCEKSAGNLDWLIERGIQFSGSFSPEKTSYPGTGIFLYYSGNEYNPRFETIAKAAPRGHRTVGKGTTGPVFYEALRKAAAARGVELWQNSPVTRLIADQDGSIVGAEISQFPAGSSALKKHRSVYARAKRMVGIVTGAGASRMLDKVAETEAEATKKRYVRAHRGVVLTTGGFIFNRPMVREYTPLYDDAQPLGTPGCDGSGIRLGMAAGGTIRCMENVMASRGIAPPVAFVKGLVVDAQGKRITAEDEYACTLGRRISESEGGTAWLIIDKELQRQALRKSLPGEGRLFLIHCIPALMSLFLGSTKGRTLEALARKTKIPEGALLAAVEEHNRIGRGEIEDPFGKKKVYRRPFGKGPYYAIDISRQSKTAPMTTLTLGGLDVDEQGNKVRRPDGSLIKGLFAAGRTAAGISSNFYLSGLSLADCVFSGRRAGRAAALNEAVLEKAAS
jgi:3-oxo-5alpha-steroid 4-dehydrogenase